MIATSMRPCAHSFASLAILVAVTATISPPSYAAEPTEEQDASRATEPERVAGLDWHTDYHDAYRAAKREGRMLLINFVPSNDSASQRNLEAWIGRDRPLRRKMRRFELARLPHDVEVELNDRSQCLVSHASFQHLGGGPGIAILDLRHKGQPYYGKVVTALPFASGKYYRWKNNHLNVALSLPRGPITQRTMVWAVRIHPEAPASTLGDCHPALAAAAARHSDHQARIGVQGHHNWDVRFHQVSAAAGAAEAKEVVAESWPDQNLIDSCIDCVASWRHSPGHWGAVRGRHRLFGYDIRRGRNGIWYGTGIFAN